MRKGKREMGEGVRVRQREKGEREREGDIR